VAWTWLLGNSGSPETAREIEECRQRLRSGVPLPLAFLLGTLTGAAGFVQAGAPVLAAPVVMVAALALWAVRWEGALLRV
jgi:hypothetical protein